MNTRIKDQKYLGRDGRADPLEIVGSEGSYLIDSGGTRYIDFVMGWCVGNIGWGNEQVLGKIRNFSGPAYVLPDFLYKPWADLAELLAGVTPGRVRKSFRATGGTEAVEIAMQAAMSHTKRNKFVSIEGSYHGHSIGAMSIGDSGFRKWYANLLPNCCKIEPPLDAEAGQRVKEILKKGDVAAFITEPIVCNLGVLIPDQAFFDIVQEACSSYGTLFIADEVATGFGRTGRMFASEHFGLDPDIVCLGKGLTGGYGGLGAAVMTDEVAKSMEFGFSFYSTFGWNPLNAEAAIANLEYLLGNRDAIIENVSGMSRYFEERLRMMKFESGADIRIKGLAVCVEFKKRGYGYRLAQKCASNGLLVSKSSNTITMFPALNIDGKTAAEGLDILERSL